MAKRPWFPLYVADWVLATAEMTLEEQGAYIRLLSLQWAEGSISWEPRRVALKLGVSLEHYQAELQAMVEAHFPSCDDGRRRNPRLEMERKIADEVCELLSERGKNGAKKRWQSNKSDASANAQAMLVDAQSQSQSHTQRDRKKQRPAKPAAPPTHAYQVVEAWKRGWVERFKPAEGRAPEPNDPDWKQVKNLLGRHGLEGTIALVSRFLDDTDKLVAERGHMLRDLPSRVARYAKGDGPLFRSGAIPPREAVTEDKTGCL